MNENKHMAVATIVSAIISKNTTINPNPAHQGDDSVLSTGINIYIEDNGEILLLDHGEDHRTGISLGTLIRYVSNSLENLD